MVSNSTKTTPLERAAGILTMCYDADWQKAIAMRLTLKARSPQLPVAVVAPPSLRARIEPHFDIFIEEKPGIKGFRHKLFLDQYSPFERTFFLDADMFVMRDLSKLIEEWAGSGFAARGRTRTGGFSSFGLDRKRIMDRLGKQEFYCVGGAGHYYFEKPACLPIFERAREVLNDYASWAPGARVADEDIFGIVMTERDHAPVRSKQIVGFIKAAKPETLDFDPVAGRCSYTDLEGDPLQPYLMHFPRNMTPWTYHRMMRRICSRFGGPTGIPWLRLGAKEFVHYSVWWGLKEKVHLLRGNITK